MERGFHKLISGQASGWFAKVLLILLRIAALFYACIIRIRNWMFRSRILKEHTAAVPVISIGNITTGGTGKTPLVMWLCNFLASKENKPCVLTRGYKMQGTVLNDEPAILSRGCRNTKVLVGSDRVRSAQKGIYVYDSDVIVLDDGFQHRRLARDLDIVTLDTTNPFGYDRMLPAGLLREPMSSLQRADAFVLTRCDQVEAKIIIEIENTLEQINPKAPIAKTIHAPSKICLRGDETIPLEQLAQKRIWAFCGIGNPDSFWNTLANINAYLVGKQVFDDHYPFVKSDVMNIFKQAKENEADLMLCTEKDWVKTVLYANASSFDIPFAYLAISLDFVDGEDALKNLIDRTIQCKISADD